MVQPFLPQNKEHMMTYNEVVDLTVLNNDSDVVHRHLPFVHKLYLMLRDLEQAKGYDHIISWIGDGKAFKIHNPSLFEASIQPKYFRQSRVASFIRQLYGYGFSKIEEKKNKYFGAYVHPDFQRNHPTQACTIQRRDTLGTDRRFKKNTNTAVGVHHQICPCHGTNKANVHHKKSLSSFETGVSTPGAVKPEVSLGSDWKPARPRPSPVVLDQTSDPPLLPSHISLLDNWIADLHIAFCSSSSNHKSASFSNGILSFAEFKSLFEPRPIECMIKKCDHFQR